MNLNDLLIPVILGNAREAYSRASLMRSRWHVSTYVFASSFPIWWYFCPFMHLRRIKSRSDRMRLERLIAFSDRHQGALYLMPAGEEMIRFVKEHQEELKPHFAIIDDLNDFYAEEHSYALS